jgi:hypothetical protein
VVEDVGGRVHIAKALRGEDERDARVVAQAGQRPLEKGRVRDLVAVKDGDDVGVGDGCAGRVQAD